MKGFQVKTNELKKGTWVLLANGWHGELWDNARGNTRIVNVYGDFTEAGSVYSHDIVAYSKVVVPFHNGELHPEILSSHLWITDIEYTPSQIKCREMANAM